MLIFENPILKRDFKIKFRAENLIKAIFIRCICIGLLFLFVLLSRLGTGLLAFMIAQAVMIMLFIPANIYDVFVSKYGKRDLSELSLTCLSPVNIVFNKLVSANIYNFMVFILSFLFFLILSIFQKKSNILVVTYAHIIIITIMFTISAISAFFCIICRRNIFISIILPYVVILLLLSSVIIVGPFFDRTESQQTKNFITNFALYANPIVILSRSFDKTDIMRTDYIYNIADPLVGRGFSYPDWRNSCIIYFGISTLLLFITLLSAYLWKRALNINV